MINPNSWSENGFNLSTGWTFSFCFWMVAAVSTVLPCLCHTQHVDKGNNCQWDIRMWTLPISLRSPGHVNTVITQYCPTEVFFVAFAALPRIFWFPSTSAFGSSHIRTYHFFALSSWPVSQTWPYFYHLWVYCCAERTCQPAHTLSLLIRHFCSSLQVTITETH